MSSLMAKDELFTDLKWGIKPACEKRQTILL